jgi:hypothetical protein
MKEQWHEDYISLHRTLASAGESRFRSGAFGFHPRFVDTRPTAYNYLLMMRLGCSSWVAVRGDLVL